MSVKRKILALPASSSRDRALEARLDRAFLKVRDFVFQKTGTLGKTKLLAGCSDIHFFRRTEKGFAGGRAFMHVGHVPRAICAIRTAAALSDSHLAALFLHEFGHLGGGDSEPEANAWVLRATGIRIQYRGPTDLQWIPADAASGILG